MTQGIKRDQWGILEVWRVEVTHLANAAEHVYYQLHTTKELAEADYIRLMRAYGRERLKHEVNSSSLQIYANHPFMFTLSHETLLDDAADVSKVPLILQGEAVV